MSQKKRYFWLKQHANFFQNLKIKKLRTIARGDTYTIIFQQIMLLSITSDGIIHHEGVENTIEEELALVLNEKIDNIKVTFAYMMSNGLVEKITETEYLLPDVPPIIGSESSSAQRVRDHRARKTTQLQCNIDVASMKRPCNTEKEKEKEKELKQKKSLLSKDKKETFYSFKQRILIEYSGYPFIINAPGFLPDTLISLTSAGYLHNEVSDKDLNTDDAKKVWSWVFGNQTSIILKRKEG